MAYVPNSDPEREAERLDHARGTRIHFGFDSSTAAIEHARLHGTDWKSQDIWYLPEEIEAVEDKLSAWRSWRDPETLLSIEDLFEFYAGAVFDFTAPQGMWFVGFTDRVEELTAILRSHNPYPDRIKPFTAKYSRDHLEDVQAAVNDDYDWREAADIRANTTKLDVRRNRVLICYSTDRSDLTDKLQARYGPEVDVAVGVSVGRAYS